MSKQDNRSYMLEAIRQAGLNLETGNGGPFGAVVVKDGKIIAATGNRVTSTNDPTAHAEIVAIREACSKLETFDLSGCEIYASCEPCPMCLGAVMWARIDKLYFAADRSDAAVAGFDDELFYEELQLPYEHRSLPVEQILQDEAVQIFDQWIEKEDKIEY